MRNRRRFQLKAGDSIARVPNCPIVHVQDRGAYPYLWIGNDALNDKICYATLSSPVALRSLAEAILKALDSPQQSQPEKEK